MRGNKGKNGDMMKLKGKNIIYYLIQRGDIHGR